MFTGIIKSIGKLTRKEPSASGMRFWVDASTLPYQPSIDDSVSVNGVCQTVVEIKNKALAAIRSAPVTTAWIRPSRITCAAMESHL